MTEQQKRSLKAIEELYNGNIIKIGEIKYRINKKGQLQAKYITYLNGVRQGTLVWGEVHYSFNSMLILFSQQPHKVIRREEK